MAEMTRLDDDVYVDVIDFGCPGNELITQNDDGSYTVLINARISYEQQKKSLKHALGHINDNDFEKLYVQEIETEAHRKDIKYEKSRAVYEGINQPSGTRG